MIIPSVKLAHIQLVSIRTVNYNFLVEDVFKLDFVQSTQTALEGFVIVDVQRKDDLNPGILSGSAKACLSRRSIMGTALP